MLISLQSIARFQTRRLDSVIKPDQVVIAPGPKPLLFTLFDILSGDVLLPRPSWVSYEPQVAHAGKKLFWVETDEHDRHTISGSGKTIIDPSSRLTCWSSGFFDTILRRRHQLRWKSTYYAR